MSTETNNLKLFKYDQTTDGNSTFNIDTALNENWDKIDNAVNETVNQIDILSTSVELHKVDNVQQLSIRPTMTTKDLIYYVNASTGSDSNDGSTSATAFKTLFKVVSVIPQIVNHNVTINIASGTYNEPLLLVGFVGNGGFSVKGGSDVTTALNYKVEQILISRCTIPVTIHGLTAISANTTHSGFWNMYSYAVSFDYCVDAVAISRYGFVSSGGSININNCSVSNKSIAILGEMNARVMSSNVSGSGNTTVYQAVENATIGKYLNTVSGTYVDAQYSSGKIVNNPTFSNLATNGYRFNDDGSIEQWGLVTINNVAVGHQLFTMTLPLAFPTTTLCYNASCFGVINSDCYVESTAMANLSTINVNVKNVSSPQNILVSYRVLGR